MKWTNNESVSNGGKIVNLLFCFFSEIVHPFGLLPWNRIKFSRGVGWLQPSNLDEDEVWENTQNITYVKRITTKQVMKILGRSVIYIGNDEGEDVHLSDSDEDPSEEQFL